MTRTNSETDTRRSNRILILMIMSATMVVSLAVIAWSTPTTTVLDELPRYYPSRVNVLDLRDVDLTVADLAGREFDLFHSMFSTRTVWPEDLPVSFQPDVLMETAKTRSPGLSVIHDMGFTGRGITVALIDQIVRVTHQEYVGRVDLQTGSGSDIPRYHGTLMAGIAIGRSVGIAPEARLRSYPQDSLVGAIEQIILDNESLPASERVRAICHASGSNPEWRGYENLQAAIASVEAAGLPVISPWMFDRDPRYLYYGLERDSYTDPDAYESFRPVSWEDWLIKIRKFPYWQERYTEVFQDSDVPVLLIPIDPVTFAGWLEDDHYIYKFISGWSQVPPFICGLYAIALQKRGDLAFDEFWDILIETGVQRFFQTDGRTVDGRIVDPVAMIEAISG